MKFKERINTLKNFVSSEEEYDYEETEVEEEEGTTMLKPIKPRSKMAGLGGMKSKTGDEIMIREFFEFQDVMEVSQALRAGTPVFCNMQRCDNDVIRRIVDFLSGTVFCLDGDIRRIGDSLFFVTPNGVTMDGNYQDDLEEAKKARRQTKEANTFNFNKDNHIL